MRSDGRSFAAAIAFVLFWSGASDAQDVAMCRFLERPDGAQVEGASDHCTVRTSFTTEVNQPGTLSVTLTRHDKVGESCAVLARLQSSLGRDSFATFRPVQVSPDDWERAFEMTAPQHDFTAAQYVVSACYQNYHLFVAALNPSRGRSVPIDIQNAAKSELRTVRDRLRGAGAVRPSQDEAEKQFMNTLGNLGTLLLPFINQLAGSPPTSQLSEVQSHPAVANAERELRDRILTAGGDPSRLDSRLLDIIRSFTGAAQLRDLNDRPALPGLRQSLPILMNLATTAATHPDPATANQAQTALGRFAAMVSRLDAEALVARSQSSTGR